MRKFLIQSLTFLGVALFATPQLVAACAGLIGSNGAVNLGRTTTLVAYHNGVEHYVTSFEFLGGGGEFGTLIPCRASLPKSNAAAPGACRDWHSKPNHRHRGWL